MIFLRVLKTLWSMLNRRRRWVFLSLVSLLFVAGVAELAGMMAIFGYIKGLTIKPATGLRVGPIAKGLHVIFNGEVNQITYVTLGGLAVLLFIGGKNLISTLAQFALTRFLMKLNQRVSTRLFEGYLLAPYEVMKRQGTEKIRNEIQAVFSVFSNCFLATAQSISDFATLAMVALLLIYVSPLLTITAVVLFGGAGTAVYLGLQRQIGELSAHERRSKGEAGRVLDDALTGIIDTRLRDARAFFSREYSVSLSQQTLAKRRLGSMQRIPRAANEILLTSLIVCSVLYLTLSGKSIHDALPTLALFGFAGLRMTGAMSRLNRSMQTLKQEADAFDEYYQLVNKATPDVFLKEGETEQDTYLDDELQISDGKRWTFSDHLKFHKVHFQYPKAKHATIRGVSFQIHKGSFVGFCGPSGGGKTTLLMLIMGLVRPTSGNLTCDGENIFTRIRQYHKMIGYVGQDLFISKGTVRQNIAFGMAERDIDDERVWRALKLAKADEFIAKLSNGLGHDLRGGSILSGGQRQRVVIARALYRQPEILILDEATAALDNTTEREISDAISSLRHEVTVICVAHRLSTIKHADVIFFMENGKISQSGTFDELLEKSPNFRAMAESKTMAELKARSEAK